MLTRRRRRPTCCPKRWSCCARVAASTSGSRIGSLSSSSFGRDHGQPRWMGVLPRSVARWYGKLRGVSQRHPLTHSAAGYRQLLEETGFEDVRIHTAFPSYSYPRVLIPLSRHSMLPWAVKKSSDWRADGLSFFAKLAHQLAASPLVARLAYPRAESLVIWARRPEPATPDSGPAVQSGSVKGASGGGSAKDSLPRDELVTKQVVEQIKARWDELGLQPPACPRISPVQLSGNWEAGGRVTWFFFSDHAPEPILLGRISRTGHDTERIANEHNALVRLRAMSDEVARHVPRLLALWRDSHHLIALQEYVSGKPAFAPKARAATAVGHLLEMCVPFLTQLARETRRELQPAQQHPYLTSLLQRAALVSQSPSCSANAREVLERLILVARRAEGAHLPIVAHHGDLNTFDILVSRDHFWVTDWEWCAFDGLPFLDFVTLSIVAAQRAAQRDANAIPATVSALIGVEPASRTATYRSVGQLASTYCEGFGLTDALRPPLAAAALLHWFVKDRNAGYEGKRYIDPPDSNPWVIAARALLEVSDLEEAPA